MKPGQTDVKIAELLPFWVNGSLNAEDAALVAAAIDADQSLAAEVDFLRGLRSQMQATDAGYSPGEIGLARLRRGIAAQPAVAPKRRDVPLRVAAAAAVVAAIVGFAANQGFRPTAVEYTQASGGEDVPALIVAFKGDATAQGLSDFLLAEGVIILDGPSAIGLYRLAPTDAATVDLATLAERLQARGDLFELVDLPE